MVIMIVSSLGYEGGMGIEYEMLQEWTVSFLTFGLSSWKGKSTSGKSFVKFSHSITDKPTVRK